MSNIMFTAVTDISTLDQNLQTMRSRYAQDNKIFVSVEEVQR